MPAFLAGCTKQEIKGEVFISTEGGDIKRISGAPIRFYQREQLEKNIADSAKNAAAAMPSYDKAIAKQKRKLAEEESELAGVTDARVMQATMSYISSIKALKEVWEHLRDAWPHAYYFVNLFPAPEFETRTDADGKFAITLPRGDWIMVAESSRRVGDSEEWYFWTYPVKGESGNILSNHNLVTSSDPDSVLQAKIGRKPEPTPEDY